MFAGSVYLCNGKAGLKGSPCFFNAAIADKHITDHGLAFIDYSNILNQVILHNLNSEIVMFLLIYSYVRSF